MSPSASRSALPDFEAASAKAAGSTSAATSSATASAMSACRPGFSAIGSKRPAPPAAMRSSETRRSRSAATSRDSVRPAACKRAYWASVETSRLSATPHRATRRRRN